MESVSTTATHTIRQMLARQPLSAAKVVFAWRVAAGPALGRAADASWEPAGPARDAGTLTLAARGATWRRELERAAPLIKDRLAFLLGPDVVRAIRVTEGPHA